MHDHVSLDQVSYDLSRKTEGYIQLEIDMLHMQLNLCNRQFLIHLQQYCLEQMLLEHPFLHTIDFFHKRHLRLTEVEKLLVDHLRCPVQREHSRPCKKN